MRIARSASSLVLIFGVTFLFLGGPHLEGGTNLIGGNGTVELSRKPEASKRASIQESFGKLPLYFIENRGQTDKSVAYYVRGADKSIYFTPSGVTFMLTQTTHDSKESGRKDMILQAGLKMEPEPSMRRWPIKLDFVGANPDIKITGEEKTPAVVSYFKGPQSEWKAGLATYASIKYHDVWPGIDLVYRGTVNQLKYEFIVNPGADPRVVKLAYNGADVKLSNSGDLEVSSPEGGFQDQRPNAYQIVYGQTKEVRSSYDSLRDDAAGRHVYGFDLGRYDKSRPLVIDPAVLVYSGYIGGSGDENALAMAVDTAGNAYVSGWTYFSDETTFPVVGGPDLTYNGDQDAFVAKLNPAGALVYAGYIGGSYIDYALGVAVDSAGCAYVTGYTWSTEATFPVVGGPDLTYNGGPYDGFVAKVNAAGTALVYSGYIGGSSNDWSSSIAVDTAGNAYVAGFTGSDETTFPVVGGPDLSFNGRGDAFVAKVNAAGTALVYSGYIGGAGDEYALGTAVDAAGNAYITGYTISTETTFPVLGGPHLTYKGGHDAFVAKVNAAGTALVYAGYIGGSGFDAGYGIAVDTAGNAYVAGETTSDETTFPVVGGSDMTYNGGPSDAFVAKVNAAGTGLVYSGYIGGSGQEYTYGIAVDSSANAYVAGYTDSDETTFPVVGGPDLTYNGAGDAFVAEVNAAGTSLVYAGYIGGSNGDSGTGVAVDSAGNAYITGLTRSTEATFPVVGGPDLTYNGAWDAFVAKVGTPPSTFSDDFEDGDYTNPAWAPNGGAWSVISGNVVGSVTKKGYLLSPSFDCTECTFEARMSVQATGRVSLFAWRLDSKHYVEVRLMQDKQKIFVKQKSGALSTKSSAKMTINPDQLYDVAITFTGADFRISVDGMKQPQLTLTPVATPSGNAEFEVKSTTGRDTSGSVADIAVN